MTPGSNLLAEALDMIEPQPVEFFRATGRTVNAAGRETVTYEPARTLWGSFQPVSAFRVSQMGLDATKEHSIFYASEAFASASREGPSDKLVYNGRQWDALLPNSWLAQDGWESVVCVDVGPVVPEPEPDNGD